jgi:hypothetical protein
MNRKLFCAAVVVAIGAAGCDPADVTSFNENPNSPTSAPAPALFTSATRNAVSDFLGNLDIRGWELVAQHLTEVQYPQSDDYTRLTSSYTNGLFNGIYSSELEDFQQVIRSGKANGRVGYWAPAAVMQAWTFAQVTDIWGDVPYSAALMGDSVALDSLGIQPPYDPQQEIYNGLFQTLTDASTAIASAGNGVTLGGADPVYSGDLDAWQRFSNSLHARLAMRIVNVDPAKASAELQAAFSAPGGVFTSNSDNAEFPWPGDGVYDNPWASNFGVNNRDDHRISDRLMTYLKGWNDPRLPVYAQPVQGTTSTYAGAPNALNQDDALTYKNTTSRPGFVFYPAATSYGVSGGSGASYPSNVMTYAEVAFLKAEAAERGLGGLSAGQAAGFYEAGIRASMDQWGVSDAAAITAYLAQPEVAYKGGVEGLKQIYTQKWIALYSDGIQAWSLFRRTCYPSNVHAGPNTIIPSIMRRFEYGTTEKSVNPHVKEAITRQGPDDLTTRMWWDTAPEAAPTYFAGCGDKAP